MIPYLFTYLGLLTAVFIVAELVIQHQAKREKREAQILADWEAQTERNQARVREAIEALGDDWVLAKRG